MNEGKLKIPVVFAVVGEPGSGKSWFSSRLSTGFDAFGIDYERLRHYLFDEVQYSNEEDAVVENTTSFIMDELFAHNRSFVVDGGANNYHFRRKLAKKCDEKGYEMVIIWLQANKDLADGRAKQSEVFKADYYKRQLSPTQIQALNDKFYKPTDKEDAIVISGNHSFESQMKRVLNNMFKRKLTTKPPKETYQNLNKKVKLPSDERRNRMRYI